MGFGVAAATAQTQIKQVLYDMADSIGMLRNANEVDRIGSMNWILKGMRVDYRCEGSAQRHVEVVKGNLAWNETEPGKGGTPAAAAANERALLLWTLPAGAIKAAAAQNTSGAIAGTITDTQGGVLPGVTLTVTNADTGVARTVPDPLAPPRWVYRSAVRVLLISMPDSFEHTPALAIRMPNGALASLAGNVDTHHEVAIADLVLAQSAVRQTVEQLVRDRAPDIVGLSVMTFQRATARRIIALIRSIAPEVFIVVGGYDPSLAPDAWTHPALGVDAIVRGEGELTFRELLRALEQRRPLSEIDGLWFRDRDGFRQTAPRPITAVEHGTIAPPQRAARVLTGYTMLGRPVDVIETSRGCTFDCSFCSIIEMRGRNFHRFPIPRVIADIADARRRGARAIFIVDDNITLDIERFKVLCEAIIEAGLTDIDYMVQGMTSAIAAHGEEVAPIMRRAGFRYVFLGIENILDDDLAFLKADAKNRTREAGRRTGNASIAAVDLLHRHGMFVIGGLIVGNPDDTPEAIAANLTFARKYVDWPYIQHPTPYPGTPMTRDFVERGLVVNQRVEEYDGTTAVTRSAHLPAGEIEFMRWKAERWMKVRHMPAAIRHDPGFILRHGHRMLAHTFRGTTWRSLVGLESARDVFTRYRAIRARERDYVDWPDPLSGRPAASQAAMPPASSLTFVKPSR